MKLILKNSSSDSFSYLGGSLIVPAEGSLDVPSKYWFSLYGNSDFLKDIRSNSLFVNDGIDDLTAPKSEQYIEKIVSLNKIKTQDKIDETRKHLIFNIRIIRLSINIFPEEIRVHLEEFFKEYIMTNFNSKQFLTIKNNPTLL